MLNVIILSTNKSEVNNIEQNKILEVPILSYVLSAVRKLSPDNIFLSVDEHYQWDVDSDVRLIKKNILDGIIRLEGIIPILPNEGTTLIMSGNIVSISEKDIEELLSEHYKTNSDLTYFKVGYGNEVIMLVKSCLLIDEYNKLSNKLDKYEIKDLIPIFEAKKYKVTKTFSLKKTNTIAVNNYLDIALASNLIKRKINEYWMEKGINIIDPFNTYIGKDVIIGDGVTIYPNNHIYGKSFIEGNVTLFPNNFIENTHIKRNSNISYSHIVNCEIGEKVSIGPFARLRDGTSISSEAKVGNFVEIKRSKIGQHTKCAHLTYIGDATIGSHTNIGCGTITANYDGVNKFETYIGDDCFIGSGTTLIAPISIGNKAFLAAGSTINKNVYDNDFAIARTRQENKTNYAELIRKKALSKKLK